MTVGDKITSLAEAAKLVQDGDTVALSGFSINRNAIAFAHELIRQGRRNLTISQSVLGLETDMLVGAGCVSRLIYAAGSLDRFGLCERVNRAYERGTVVAEAYSGLSIGLRYLAGSLGLPFVPTKTLLGTEVLRRLVAETAPSAVRESSCPFTGDPVVLLRPLRPRIAVMQVQMADEEGNARIYGALWDNKEAANAADKVIVITEQLVSGEEIRKQPELTTIAGYRVEAVVHAPYAAHPTALYRCYDYDRAHLELYTRRNKSDAGFQEYLHEFVLEPKDHGEYLERVGGRERIARLAADWTRGY